MKIHNIKSTRKFYDLVVRQQEKSFEVRYNDRDYQAGDLIVFWEVNSEGLETGCKSKPFIIEGYVLKHEDFPQGLQPGYCVFSIVPHQLYSCEFPDSEIERRAQG